MFITAADIGKFLSGLVIKFYGKMRACLTWMASVADAMRDYVSSDVDSIDSRCAWLGIFAEVFFWSFGI